MKIFASHVDAYQRLTPAEEDFNQVNRMNCFVVLNQPLSQPPLSLQQAREQSAVVARVEVVHGLSNMDIYSARLT